MTHQLEFSKNAKSYDQYNIIQAKVIEQLLLTIKEQPQKIIDLGCGKGGVYKAIDWEIEHFVGIDFAKGMLELHPKAKNVECIYGDFNDTSLFEHLFMLNSDYLISASALQWADDLDKVCQNIQGLHLPFSLAIFTSGTFKTLNDTAHLKPLLRSSDTVQQVIKQYFDVTTMTKQYTLSFGSTREMFQYIKKSGVSGGRKVLDYKQTKELMQKYPLDYLEFEVLFISSK